VSLDSDYRAGNGERKLAALMFTDMVGYSRLVQCNERQALELLEEHRQLVRAAMAAHAGREVDMVGDGFLIEFASALKASQCAIEIQTQLHERNLRAPPPLHIQLRIGLHLGDVLVRDGRLVGDGVNIAARIEPLAAPGGIALSRAIYDQIQNKIPFPLNPLGERDLKNITSPVDLYEILLPWTTTLPSTRTRAWTQKLPWLASKPGRAQALVAALVMTSCALLWILWPESNPGAGSGSPTSQPSLSGDELRKLNFGRAGPRVAVLQFQADPETNPDLASALTQELLVALASATNLSLVDKSMHQWSESLASSSEMLQELGADFLLYGSVSSPEQQIRVKVNVFEVRGRKTSWTDEFTRPPTNSHLQAKILGRMVGRVLKVRFPRLAATSGSAGRAAAESFYLKGRAFWNNRPTGLSAAFDYFQQAVGADPNYPLAYSGLADCYGSFAIRKLMPFDDAYQRAKTAAETALELDERCAEAKASLGLIKENYQWDWVGAAGDFAQAVAWKPDYADAHFWYGINLGRRGRYDQARAQFKQAIDLGPLVPGMLHQYGLALAALGQYEPAIAAFTRELSITPDHWDARFFLAATYEAKGELPRAVEEYVNRRRLLGENAEVLSALKESFRTEGIAGFHELELVHASSWLPRAQAYARLGRREELFTVLESAYAQREYPLMHLNLDLCFAGVRSDPRYLALVERMGLNK
jgi:adenylate cyclase